jgi:hypothetical protein
MRMKVYRIENIFNEGPYSSGEQKLWRRRSHGGVSHPEPQEDLINGFKKGPHFCGFSSMQHLFQWFAKTELLRLHDLGFRIQVYSVDSKYVRLGVKQVVFTHSKAKAIGKGRAITEELK